jgi:hypothetical protein
MPDLVLLTLMCPPQLEDAIVDWMLSAAEVRGFSSHPASGHSSRLEGMSLTEQVTGRTQRIRFEIQLPDDMLEQTLDSLRSAFAKSGVHYWIVPVLDAGSL